MLTSRVLTRRLTRRRSTGDHGTSMVELLVGMSILTLLLTMSVLVVTSMLSTQNTATERSERNYKMSGAVLEIERHVRAAEVLYDPAAESTPGFFLRLYSKAGGTGRCHQWRVSDAPNRLLQGRSWLPGGTPTAWRTVARGFNNTSAQQPFINAGATYRSRLINVHFVLGSGTTTDAEVKSSFSARNVGSGTSATICDPAPAP